jgi:hypothetical protein
LALTAILFAALALPAFASAAVKAPLLVVKSGEGTVTSSPSGINCGSVCKANFFVETPIVLTATPKAGSFFVGWFGCDAEPSANKCEITVFEEEEPTIEAEFNEIEKFFLVLEKSGTGEGTVTSSPAGINCGTSCAQTEHEYLEGTTVVLTASESSGSVFEGWSGCDTEPSATKCEVTIAGETTISAEFVAIEKFPLVVEKTGTGQGTVTSLPAGINCGTACPKATAEYLEGTTVVLTASVSVGSVFEGWTGCDTPSATNKCEATIAGETIVEAEFGFSFKPKFSLDVKTSGTGTGTVRCNGGTCASSYDQGTKVTLAASAASGSSFSGFSGGGCSGTGNCVVTIEANTTVTAVFKANPPSTCATNPSLCPAVPGKAKAAGSAQARGGKALLKLSCSGGPCQGKLNLTAKVKRAYKTTNAVIGKASFSLADGASATLKVKLISAAKQELDKGKTIRAKLTGGAIVSSMVKLKPAKK